MACMQVLINHFPYGFQELLLEQGLTFQTQSVITRDITIKIFMTKIRLWTITKGSIIMVKGNHERKYNHGERERNRSFRRSRRSRRSQFFLKEVRRRGKNKASHQGESSHRAANELANSQRGLRDFYPLQQPSKLDFLRILQG
ncbi:Protocadherin Fat 3 [Sesbania bispinosa]|nr:Protocadherin Fat 3 [Sesbania bispinosa]